MVWIKNERNIAELKCGSCNKQVCFKFKDMKHYRHDVDGNNVYITCPNCETNLSCYKQAVSYNWVEP